MIRLKAVNKSFGAHHLIKDFSYDFLKGITVISAPSGSGKTTLLRIIAGLEQPDSGNIEFSTGGKIAMVFQEDRLIPSLNVCENVALIAKNSKTASFWLEVVGLSDYRNYPISKLSGGMKRRVALARALSHSSDVLLLDEPLNGLDLNTKLKLIYTLKNYCKDKVCIAITHEQADALALSETILNFSGSPLTLPT